MVLDRDGSVYAQRHGSPPCDHGRGAARADARLARGEDADAALLQLAGRVNAMNAAGDFAGAAKLAAASAADARFEAPLRVMFGVAGAAEL